MRKWSLHYWSGFIVLLWLRMLTRNKKLIMFYDYQVLSEYGVSAECSLWCWWQSPHSPELSEGAGTPVATLILPSQTYAATHQVSASSEGQSFKYQYWWPSATADQHLCDNLFVYFDLEQHSQDVIFSGFIWNLYKLCKRSVWTGRICGGHVGGDQSSQWFSPSD